MKFELPHDDNKVGNSGEINSEKKEKLKMEWGIESPNEMGWHDAWEYCRSFGEGWRLPKSEEIKSALEAKTINARSGAKYWTSWHYGPTSSWYGYDESGKVTGDHDSKNSKNWVIPVKG